MAHTIEDKIIELADKYTLNHSNESFLNNMAMLEEFRAYISLEYMKQETLLPDEFLVRCYEDNQLCYRKREVYVAELVEQPNIIKRLFPQYSNKLLKVWYHGSTVRDGKREGMYNDIFVSPLQQGNIFAIGNFERIC